MGMNPSGYTDQFLARDGSRVGYRWLMIWVLCAWVGVAIAHCGLAETASSIQAGSAHPAIPAAARGHNQLGLKYLSEGKLNLASAEFQAAISQNPHFVEALNNLGVVRGRQGRSEESERLLRQAVESDPYYAEAYVNLGLLLMHEQRLAEAKEEIKKALSISPDYAPAYSALGMIQAKLGLPRRAVESFRKVTQLEPLSAEAHLNLGIALAEESSINISYLDQALIELDAAEKLDPNSPPIHYHRGRVLFNLRRYPEAEQELETALRFNPRLPAALYLLALDEEQLNHVARSTALAQRAIVLDSRNADLHYLLGQDFFRAGRMPEAIAQWRKAVELDPEHLPALYNLALALRKSDRRKAQEYGARYLELQSKRQATDLAKSSELSAKAAVQRGNWPAAVTQLQKALEFCGDCAMQADLRKSLGLAYCYANDLQDGKNELERVLETKPEDREVKRALEIIERLEVSRRPK